MRHYGIPAKLVKIITNLYTDFSAQVICSNSLTDTIEIKTGVKQGCILSAFLFMQSMDWIMRKVESPDRRGVRWTRTTQLENLDFVDDICLTPHRLSDMQSKTEKLSTTAQNIGLKASITKNKHMRMNSRTNEPIKLQGENIEEVEEFTYLG